jgi:hypothetical protein
LGATRGKKGMSEKPKTINLEESFKKRVENRVKELKENPKSQTSEMARNDGVCIYCKTTVHRGDNHCSECGKPVTETSFQCRVIEHNVRYNALDDPSENMVMTEVVGGRIVKIVGRFPE